ncbi:MAG: hypothetical protein ACI9W2_000034 [Gammaproteobacteria bacterium]|jgi:hypothetical protein
MTFARSLLVTLMCTFAASVFAKQVGTISRTTALRERPNPLGTVIAKLPSSTEVEIFARRGYWVEVVATDSKNKGWVRSLRVRVARRAQKAKPTSSNGGNIFASIARGTTAMLGGGTTDTSNTRTTTIGIRGLTPDELRAAAPDTRAVEQLARARVSSAKAKTFAQQGKLRAQSVAHKEGSSVFSGSLFENRPETSSNDEDKRDD